MPENVLCIDIGNSHTVVGIYAGPDIVEYWRLRTIREATSDEVYLRLRGLLAASTIDMKQITHIGLSSVVPALERVWVKAMSKLLYLKVEVVSDQNCLGLPIHYDLPSQVGADRLANIIGLKSMGIENGMVVDLGTATTFDICFNGAFRGGIILAGIDTSLEALTEKAVRLMPVSLSWTDKIIATNTDDAIRSGLLHGFLGQMEYLIQKIRDELGVADFPIWATGGWSTLLMDKTKVIERFEPFLTLLGIKLVALGKDVVE